MKSYATYEELAIGLDLHPELRTKILKDAGMPCMEGWFVVTDNGQCYFLKKDGTLDDIRKIRILRGQYIREDIKQIVIPNSVQHIRSYAFDDCTSLTNISISDSVNIIGDWVFYNCESLAKIIIPNSVQNIGDEAFYHCTSLKEVVFKGKTLRQIRAMKNYPWGIEDKSIIKVNE
jgi:hypothetical protein